MFATSPAPPSPLSARPPLLSDAEALHPLLACWEVAANAAGVPYPLPPGLLPRWIEAVRQAEADGVGMGAVVVVDQRPIGAVSLQGLQDDSLELGYWIGQPYWGRGYASRAASEVIQRARDLLRPRRLVASYFMHNPASGRVQKKLGFRVIGLGQIDCLATGAQHPCIHTERIL
jgi:RimJ/RimL family protein N-acetyltransferase